MAWVRYTCGRLKSDYRYYQKDIVYNNFPWPQAPTPKQKEIIEQAAQSVLDTRKKYPDSSLADLYDPLTMPADLLKAHQKLDKAVDAAYGKRKFATEAERVAYLFELYQNLTTPLLPVERNLEKNVRRPSTTLAPKKSLTGVMLRGRFTPVKLRVSAWLLNGYTLRG